MLLRQRQTLRTTLIAIAAMMAILVYAFASPATHAPSQHAFGNEIALSNISVDHGDHSHDELDVASTDQGVDHHHPDHSHEKLGLAASARTAERTIGKADFVSVARSLVSGPPYGIHRPPRFVNTL